MALAVGPALAQRPCVRAILLGGALDTQHLCNRLLKQILATRLQLARGKCSRGARKLIEIIDFAAFKHVGPKLHVCLRVRAFRLCFE